MTPKPKNDMEDGSPEGINNENSTSPEIDKWSNLIYGEDGDADKPIAAASVWKQLNPTKPESNNDKDWQKIIYGEQYFNDNISNMLDDWDNEADNTGRFRYKWRSFAKLEAESKRKIGKWLLTVVAAAFATLLVILIVMSEDYNLSSDYYLPNGQLADPPQFETGDATLKIDGEVEPFVITDTKMRTIVDDKKNYEESQQDDSNQNKDDVHVVESPPLVEISTPKVEERLWFEKATDDDVRKLFEIEKGFPPLLRRVV